jgi:hypothetical protein
MSLCNGVVVVCNGVVEVLNTEACLDVEEGRAN